MIETKLLELVKAGETELLLAAADNLLKTWKSTKGIEKLFVNTGKHFANYEIDEDDLSEALKTALSKENMLKLANELKAEPGYRLKDRLTNSLMVIMNDYEIPHDIAVSYSNWIISAILTQLAEVAPEKYDRVYLAECRAYQEQCFEKLDSKLDRVSKELELYKKHQLEIQTADEIDLKLKRQTRNPQIGIDFFNVDDDSFKKALGSKKADEIVCIKARCKEEAIYCIINELWLQNEVRPIYIVRKREDWNYLAELNRTGNIFIPWFFSDEIEAIPNNTNIFIFTEGIPSFSRSEIVLRPRTYSTITAALERAGMEINEANKLVSETHGLFVPMKKKIFNGAYYREPRWLKELPKKVKETALLLGQWTDSDGDKAVVESLSAISYDLFIGYIEKYSKDEDPFIHIVDKRTTKEYYLASEENSWDYIDVTNDSDIWKRFQGIFIDVLNESEKLFTYSDQDRLMAQFRGEKVFWSSIIRQGMIRSLIMKACYKDDQSCQNNLDWLVKTLLSYIDSSEKWRYISNFFMDLCEVSPKAVLERLVMERSNPTGLMDLFEHQSSDVLWGRNDYVKILWGIEEFLTQPQYASAGLEWLLYLDDLSYEYKSNTPKEALNKVFCTWHNFSAFLTADDKIAAAQKAFKVDKGAWDCVFKALPINNNSIVGELYSPKYRAYIADTVVQKEEMIKTNIGYLELLISHTEFNPERWNALISIYKKVDDKTRTAIEGKLLFELSQMTDHEKMSIKNSIRSLIYKNRYYSSAEWAMKPNVIDKLLDIKKKIQFVEPEYDYVYFLKPVYEGVILDPVPYDKDGEREINEQKTKSLYRGIIEEFKDNGYSLKKLTELCSENDFSTLGSVLAEYWDDGTFSKKVFMDLYRGQNNHQVAIDYLENLAQKGEDVFHRVIELTNRMSFSDDFIIELYRIEAVHTEARPLISEASREKKKAFWKDFIWRSSRNMNWALDECRQYGSVDSYLYLLYHMNREHKFSPEELYEKLCGINMMDRGRTNSMVDYYLKELLKPVQKEYLNNPEKRAVVARIELAYFYALHWDDMRCFKAEIKHDPAMYVEMASIIFRCGQSDSAEKNTENNQNYARLIKSIFDKAKFCPGENSGHVRQEDLEKWVEEFIRLLRENGQSNLFGMLLGRLFAYSPIGEDGYYPCEAVREIIEKYADESMLGEYEREMFNEREIYIPSAGKEERKIADVYRQTAEHLYIRYPKTAEVFNRLGKNYIHDSERERQYAECGYY